MGFLKSEYERLVLLEHYLKGYIKVYPDDIEAQELKERSDYMIRGWFPDHGCYSPTTYALKFDSSDADVLGYKEDVTELIDELVRFFDKKKDCNNSAIGYNRLYSLIKQIKKSK